MKLIIDIPEIDYNTYKHFGNKGTYSERIIANGTPYEEENTCDEREEGNCPFYTARGDV